MIELELSTLDRRYEQLRGRGAQGEALAAMARGQGVPIVVAREGERWVVIEGFTSIRAFERLKEETAQAVEWKAGASEALVLREKLRRGKRPSRLEEGWLVDELERTEGWATEEVAGRLGRSRGWVKEREGLVGRLPASAIEVR